MSGRGHHTPEAIERIRAAQQRHWSDVAARERHGALTKRRMARPGVSERIAERTKAALADPETRARQRAAIRSAMARPAVRARISDRTREAMSDPAVRERIRDGMARARSIRADLQALWALWVTVSADARQGFLDEVVSVMPDCPFGITPKAAAMGGSKEACT